MPRMFSPPLAPNSGPWLLDGGMGSGLLARGLPPGRPAELWNVQRPETVRDLHAEFLRAGSRVVQTNTFGANRPTLQSFGWERDLRAINEAAVRLAREAIDWQDEAASRSWPTCWVAGNLGPLRVQRQDPSDTDATRWEAAFAEQAGVLAESGVDFLAIETMTHLGEALAALRGARSTGLPVTICLTVRETSEGFRTPAGDPLADAVRSLQAAGAAAVGVNCSEGTGPLLRALPIVRANATVPVIAKPNAGLPKVTHGRAVYPQSQAEFARDGVRLVDLGAQLIGGCCGVDAGFLAELGRRLSEREAPR